MKLLRSRRGLAALAALLLILFLLRPGVHPLRNRIAHSLGSALGRKVTLDNVRVRLLPRPGFDLEGLVVYDGPAFGAEPMVRAQDVSAAIRLRSLLRGRLEIATLSATEPSINLVRNNDGRWNLSALLERNARIPAAPTGKPAPERPAFPYLEASRARINFKLGQEKKSYALADADLALWQESENSWGVRMTAQPVRTDFNLTDTGRIQVNATWQRAASLRETPMQIAVRWENGQLGQITKLFSGRDLGWRGSVSLSANISGTPEAATIRSQAGISGFHRYDILGGESVRLATECSGRYNAMESSLDELSCLSPIETGTIRLRGSAGAILPVPSYDLTLSAEKVPLRSVLQLLRQAKKELPADLSATGPLDAEFHAAKSRFGQLELGGAGTAADVRLSVNAGKDEIRLGTIPLALMQPDRGRTPFRKKIKKENNQNPAEGYLKIGPFPLGMGGAEPASAGGWIAASGYRFFLRGDTEVKNLFRLANTLGLPGARPAAEGAANVGLSVAGPWQGFTAPIVLGSAQLRNLRSEMRGLNAPIEIESATVTLTPDTISLEKISAQTGSTHWNGVVTRPRRCAPACVSQFDLSADQLSSNVLVEWFKPQPAKRPWYRLLTSSERSGPSPLLATEAQGKLRVGRLILRKVEASQITAHVELDQGKITLADLRGQVFQGIHRGDWVIDVSAAPPHYQAKGTLQNVSLGQVSAAMNDAWISGSGDGKFDVTTSGSSFADLMAHAEGGLQFTMRNGTLPHIEFPGAAKPFPVHLFTGTLELNEGTWEMHLGRLESRDGIYQVSGKASTRGGLDLMLKRGDNQTWNLTGTLAKPRLAHVNHTEAETNTASKRQ